MKFSFIESYSSISKHFGLDISLIYYRNFLLIIEAVLAYLVLLPISVLYFYQDFAPAPIIPLSRSMQYSSARGIFALAYLSVMSAFVAFYQRARQRQTLNTGEYCALLSNLPTGLSEHDVACAVEKKLGRYCVESIALLRNPHSFYLKEKLFAAEKEYYGRMQEGGYDLRPTGEQAKGQCWRKTGMLKVAYICGFCRDYYYYETKIQAIERQIKTENVEHFDGKDAAVLSLDSSASLRYLIHTGRKVLFYLKIEGQRIKIEPAPAPDDLIYSGLCCNQLERFGKQLLTLLIVCAISGVNFLIMCLLRQLVKQLQNESKSILQYEVTYWGIFIVTMLFDLLFRPIIYWAVSFERHCSIGGRERSWMLRLYIYYLLNKFAVIFSRPVVEMLTTKQSDYLRSFNAVFYYTTTWRRGSNTGGSDLYSLMYTCIFGYPVLEFVFPLLYKLYYRLASVTSSDRQLGKLGADIRYASLATCILVSFTMVVSFAHVYPEMLLLFAAFILVYSAAIRLVQSTITRNPYRIANTAVTYEIVEFIGLVIAVLVLSLSYDMWYLWYIFGLLTIILVYFVIYISMHGEVLQSDEVEANSALKSCYSLPEPPYTLAEKTALKQEFLGQGSAAVPGEGLSITML